MLVNPNTPYRNSIVRSCSVAWGANRAQLERIGGRKRKRVGGVREAKCECERGINRRSKAPRVSRANPTSTTATTSRHNAHGEESSPEAHWAVVLDRLDEAVGEAVVDLGVGGLVHERGPDPVERGHGARHEEARHEGAGEAGPDVLPAPAGCARREARG
jgi:hypothetical protein